MLGGMRITYVPTAEEDAFLPWYGPLDGFEDLAHGAEQLLRIIINLDIQHTPNLLHTLLRQQRQHIIQPRHANMRRLQAPERLNIPPVTVRNLLVDAKTALQRGILNFPSICQHNV